MAAVTTEPARPRRCSPMTAGSRASARRNGRIASSSTAFSACESNSGTTAAASSPAPKAYAEQRLRVIDVLAVDVQRRRAGDDDEHADDAGQHGAANDVDALVAQILHGQPGRSPGPRTATSATAPARRPRIPASARCGPRRTRCGGGERLGGAVPGLEAGRHERAMMPSRPTASDPATGIAVTDRAVTTRLGRPSSLKTSTGWARGSSRPSSSRPWRPIVADLSSGDRPEKSTNGPTSRQHVNTNAALGALEREQTLSDTDQTLSDSDQTLADADQTSGERDQADADRDQVASDRDQAASDRDLVRGVDPESTTPAVTSAAARRVSVSRRPSRASTAPTHAMRSPAPANWRDRHATGRRPAATSR